MTGALLFVTPVVRRGLYCVESWFCDVTFWTRSSFSDDIAEEERVCCFAYCVFLVCIFIYIYIILFCM